MTSLKFLGTFAGSIKERAMKVYIICRESFPNGMAGTNRIKCYAKALQLGGIDCTVINYTRTETKGSTRNPERAGVWEGIPFFYVGEDNIKPPHKIPRLWRKYKDQFLLKMFLRRNLEPGDVVIGYVNSDTDLLCRVIDIIHSKGASYVRELCEIPFFGGQSRKEKKGLEDILGRLFPKCDGFISISDPLTELAKEHMKPEARILKLPILVDYDGFLLPDKSEEADVPYIFHSGTLFEQKDGVLGMIEAFGKAFPRIGRKTRMVFTGNPANSPDGKQIKEMIARYGLEDRITFTGFIDYSTLKDYLSKASLVVINKHPNIQNKYCFSTKLGEYLAAGKPVVITDVGEAMNYLTDGKNAYVVRRDDVNALSDAIVKAFTNEEERKRIGEAGRILCKEAFDYRSVSSRFSDFLRSLQA